MHIDLKRVTLILLLSLSSQFANAGLPPGITGAWYNPAQSGHGVSVEIIAPDRAILFWYVYDQNGLPMPLYVEGKITGREIRGVAYNPNGMRFGSFNPADHRLPVWGEVGMTFTDCSTATLDWQAESATFGSGSLPFERLAKIDGLDCSLPSRTWAPVGGYTLQNEYFFGFGSNNPVTSGYAAIDANGMVWAVDALDNAGFAIPGPTFVGQYTTVASIGTPVRVTDSERQLRIRATDNSWALRAAPSPLTTVIDDAAIVPDGLTFKVARLFSATNTLSLTPASQPIVAPITLDRLARRYVQPLRGQFVTLEGLIDIDADGNVCIDTRVINSPTPCTLAGRVVIVDGDDGFFDIELTDARDAAQSTYRGRGWLQGTESGERLVIVATNGAGVMGLIAR